mmetsp:Transcript_4340/g.4991  ORF Transcript_4340/g.4991 Transcript_4340/m.4991 type:complete len:83 (-) Transcript_4340:147-395(-)
MKLIREYVDKDAYLPSEYTLNITLGFLPYYLKLLNKINEEEYIFPQIKTLKFTSSFSDSFNNKAKKEAEEIIDRFIIFEKTP